MRDAGVDGLFLAVWAPHCETPGENIEKARAQLARIHDIAEAIADRIVLARDTAAIKQAHNEDRIAMLIGIEGGYLIEDSIDILREYHEKGAAYLTLTHAAHTSWADSAGVHEDLAPRHHGLTDFGKDVIRELNRLGMMVDISHVSDETFWQTLDVSTAPIIATHSSCRAVSPHRRNISDDMIRAIADKGGVVQINFASYFLDPNHPPLDATKATEALRTGKLSEASGTRYDTPLRVLIDHFDHALRLVGPQHVGIGTDFDGVPAVPKDMEDISMLPNLTASLLARGYSAEDLEPMLGANVMRVMDACASDADKT